MKKLLPVAAVAEVVTGMALIVVPSLVGRLLFGTDLSGVSIPVARVTGIALIGLGTACWPGPASDPAPWWCSTVTRPPSASG